MASDIVNGEMALQIAQNESGDLAQIDEALRKIDDSTYGICEGCNKTIPAPRLEVLPFATLCVRCKEKQESGESLDPDGILADIAPTLTDWCVLDGTELEGRSLLALTDSYIERDFDSRPAFGSSRERGLVTARDAQWRLVADVALLAGGGGDPGLYPVESQAERPREMSAERPDVVRGLVARLRERFSAGGGE